MVPYAQARGDFNAVYFARVKPRLGLYVVPLDDATRRALQTNAGVLVSIVMEGSPAFDADILPGDVLLRVDEERVSSVEAFNEIVPRFAGRTATLHLVREAKPIAKTVTLRH